MVIFFAIENKLVKQVEHLDARFDLNLTDSSKPLLQGHSHNAFYLESLFAGSATTFTSNNSFQKLTKAIANDETTSYEVPDILSNVLRDYQKIGFSWMKSLSTYNFGGILADDMGLGKTIQAITLMVDSGGKKPSLVVAPTSLIYNWEEEVHKFAPNTTTKVIAGTKQERQTKIDSIQNGDVVITSYGALKRDLELYKQDFDFCFIDEAQHIKNPRSQNSRATKSIRSKYRFALTGTPIENTLSELWSIFDFILPGYLGSHSHFVKHYENPIVKKK